MKYTIRMATKEDENAFREIWGEHLMELASRFDGETDPNSVDFFVSMFLTIVASPDQGTVLVAESESGEVVGVLMWGGICPMPFNTRFGNVAMGWGTHVKSEHRGEHLSSRLRYVAREQLSRRGFDTVLGAVHVANDAGHKTVLRQGFKPYAISYSLDLTAGV